jgi:hypothetical protein
MSAGIFGGQQEAQPEIETETAEWNLYQSLSKNQQ